MDDKKAGDTLPYNLGLTVCSHSVMLKELKEEIKRLTNEVHALKQSSMQSTISKMYDNNSVIDRAYKTFHNGEII
jgi:hypothetical protein